MSVSPLSQLPEAFLRRTRAWLSPPDFDAWCASVERPPLAVRWTGASEATAEGRSYLLEQGFEIEDVPWLAEAWSLGQISRETVSRLPMVADQLLFMRPTASSSQYSTPFDNLFLCGPGTHPGGGLHGMNGYNAAKKVLKR